MNRRVLRFATVLLVASLLVGWLNLVAMAAAVHPWLGVGVLAAGAALPFLSRVRGGE